MRRVPLTNGRNRKRPEKMAIFQLVNILGIGMLIACVLATLGIIVLEARQHVAPR
jgi:hypothetical protein